MSETTTGFVQVLGKVDPPTLEEFAKTWQEWAKASPCPACGHCPTCGRGGYNTSPHWTIPGYNPQFPYTVTYGSTK
jgi:hypothetical protein